VRFQGIGCVAGAFGPNRRVDPTGAANDVVWQ
jgi:hypothetical protein